MAYASLQDLIDRYGSQEMTALTDRAGTGSPDPATAEIATADASNMIDSYIAGRYQLPLDPVPGSIQRIACDIARFYLWKDAASDAVLALYKSALQVLTGIQGGAITLEAASVNTPVTGDAVQLASPSGLGSPRLFDDCGMRNF